MDNEVQEGVLANGGEGGGEGGQGERYGVGGGGILGDEVTLPGSQVNEGGCGGESLQSDRAFDDYLDDPFMRRPPRRKNLAAGKVRILFCNIF